jgi:hypothetical protein
MESSGQDTGSTNTPTIGAESTQPFILVTPVATLVGEEPPPTFEPVIDPSPMDPMMIGIESDLGTPYTPEQLVRSFELIIQGTVIAILPSIWTTPDGKRPENPHETVPEKYAILTPVVVKITDAPIVTGLPSYFGDLKSGIEYSDTIVIGAFGGTIGKDWLSNDASSQHFSVDENIIVALSSRNYWNRDHPGLYVTSEGVAWTSGKKYTIIEGDKATSVGPDGAIVTTVSDLIDSIHSAVIDISKDSSQPGLDIVPTSTPES